MSSITQWCDTPSPSAKRPPHTAWVDSACWASAIGWRGCTGTTAVPISMREVSAPTSAAAVSASKSSGICGIHTAARPASSAQRGVGAQPLHLGAVPAPLRTQHHPDPHPDHLSATL